MTFTKEINGDSHIIKLSGRLDTTTSPKLESALRDELGNANTLIMDLSDLEYISSAGLRVLLFAHKEMSTKGGMIVKNPSEDVTEIFEITGFSDILTIE